MTTKSFRHLFVLVLMGACIACSDSRTVPPGEEVGDQVATPIFTAPIDQVQDAVVRACQSYYRRVDLDDRDTHRVEVLVSTVWAGSSDVAVQLHEDGGATTVDITSKGVGPDAVFDGRPSRDVRELARRITDEMSR